MQFTPPATEETERLVALLRATAERDVLAFRRLYEATSSHLFGLLVRMLRQRDWAEEALQDCYLKIWNRAESYAPDKGTPLAWMMTIARYRALDLLRARREHLSLDDDSGRPEPIDLEPGPADDAETQEQLHRLEDCLTELPDEQRRSVLLAYYEGYTHSELASQLSSPLGTVKSWVRRGLSRLRECLDP
ncbi:sigma-70 family RNA polymerase sigma factor [Flagellatimonas centrodinii]|uniref:sigma-70 family RNA polymerase sigma factor n=1 Tax=Flagellatimonas centrodinii TaxID=2806210 RepID=UPI001FED87EE|nr:sigma-70 family RNA polymerase sigma factor [Flagellatimonas centrodinii]ULQ47909.1 sigma-70 family RNA polymerase sigma factor [Flagellatimonas centrodinii]